MKTWAYFLREAPATLQRLIARHNRVSLPRGCSADERVRRIRGALIHQRTVRVTYFSLDAVTQAALQDLRHRRYGIRPDDLFERYGTIRPLKHIAADPQPQTISERLLLLGWLLPRPAAPFNPPIYLVPPDVRQWLPQPLDLPNHGSAAPMPVVPIVRAASALLLLVSERPLNVREDGLLRQGSIRLLTERLAPLSEAETTPLIHFLLPLLYQLDLLERRGGRIYPTAAASRFLSRPHDEQRMRLQQTWIGQTQPDSWLRRLLITDRGERGINWPTLRRRLCAWAAALPEQRYVALAGLHDALHNALGPLADPHTHSYRHVDRTPWQPRRATAVFEAALRGPLHWFGIVAWGREVGEQGGVRELVARVAGVDAVVPPDLPADFALPTERDAAELPVSPTPDTRSPIPWRYGSPGEVIIPHACEQASTLRLLPFAEWRASDAESSTYRVDRQAIAHAGRHGWSDSVLWRLLERQAGPPPAEWKAELEGKRSRIRLRHTGILIADDPAVLTRAAETRTVTRYLETRLAPGIALVPPEKLDLLAAALSRQDIVVDDRRNEDAPAPRLASGQELTAAECASLLIASAFYRQHAPPEAPHLPHSEIGNRLRGVLTPALRQAVDAALTDMPAPGSVTAQEVEERLALAEQRMQAAEWQRATAERRSREWERRARQAEARLAEMQPDPPPAPKVPASNFWSALSEGGEQGKEECEPQPGDGEIEIAPGSQVRVQFGSGIITVTAPDGTVTTHPPAVPSPLPIQFPSPDPESPLPVSLQSPLSDSHPATSAFITTLVVWFTLLLALLPGQPTPRRRSPQHQEEEATILPDAAPSPDSPPPPPDPRPPSPHPCALNGDPLPLLRRAIARRYTLRITYDTGGRGTLDTRLIRPLYLEAHGPVWYLRAYCPRHHAERTFRVDRLHALVVAGGRPRRGDPEARQWRKQWPVPTDDAQLPQPPQPPPKGARRGKGRASFFPGAPEPGTPRVWVEE